MAEFRLVQMVVGLSGKHHQQVARGYSSQLMSRDKQLITRKITEHSMVTANSLASLDTPVVSINATPNSNVNIAPIGTNAYNGGWSDERSVFILTLESLMLNKEVHERYHVTGYSDVPMTDHAGELNYGANLRFNHVSVMRWAGNRWVVKDSSQLLTPTSMSDSSSLYASRTDSNIGGGVYVRPSDVLLRSEISSVVEGHDDDTIVIVPNQASSHMTFSKDGNNNPLMYGKRLMGAINDSVISKSTEEEFWYDSANSSYVAETDRSEFPLIRHINSATLDKMGAVTMQVLAREIPELQDSTRIQVIQQDTGVTGDGNSYMAMNGTSARTLVAVTLMRAVPAIMAETGIHTISFTLTNQTSYSSGDDQCKFNVDYDNGEIHCGTMETDFDVLDALRTLEHRVINEVMPIITRNNSRMILFKGTFDLLKDSIISISVDGADIGVYAEPTFASAKNTAVIDSGDDGIRSIMNTVSDLRDSILSAVPYSRGANNNEPGPINMNDDSYGQSSNLDY